MVHKSMQFKIKFTSIKNKEKSDTDHGTVVGARWPGLSISENADFMHNSV